MLEEQNINYWTGFIWLRIRYSGGRLLFHKRRRILWAPRRLSPLHGIRYKQFFYVLLTVHPCIIFFTWSQLGAHYFLVYLFQLLYMFRATMCPLSGELTVSMRHWYFSLCMGGCLVRWYIYFNFSACFGELGAHHQENLLYLCDTRH